MPYKVSGKTIYKKEGGKWKKWREASSHAKAVAMVQAITKKEGKW